ncbi:MAG: iron ABC transporter permease [Phototrophicales bacterium]
MQVKTTTQRIQITPARRRGPLVMAGLWVFLIISTIASIGIGQVEIEPDQIITILLDEIHVASPTITIGDFNLPADYTTVQKGTVTIIRLPRVILGLMVGAALAAAGTLIQGMFRNPLADPGLIGISGGAAFSAALMIVLGNTVFSGLSDLLNQFGIRPVPIAAFLGGIITTFLIYRLATVNGRTSVPTMLLAGIAINSLAGAGIGLLISFADDNQVRDITFWNLGSLVDVTWERVETTAPFILISILPMLFLSRQLNALLLGETEAQHLGVNVQRTKQAVVLLSALAVGVSVSAAGIIGFVGLVVPHLVRLMVGPDHRYVIPGSLLLGAGLLVTADLAARNLTGGSEILLGVVTALIGAPFFLYLLLRDRQRGALI